MSKGIKMMQRPADYKGNGVEQKGLSGRHLGGQEGLVEG